MRRGGVWEEWERKGWLRRWAGRLVRLCPDGGGVADDLSPPPAAAVFTACGGMERLCQRLAEQLRGTVVNTGRTWAEHGPNTGLQRPP